MTSHPSSILSCVYGSVRPAFGDRHLIRAVLFAYSPHDSAPNVGDRHKQQSTVAAAIATAAAAATITTVIRLIIALESAQPLSVSRPCSRPPKSPSLSSRSEAHTYQKAGRTKTTSHPHTCKQPPAVSHTGSKAAFTSQSPQESHSSPPPVPRLAAPGLLPQTTLQGPGILRICTSFYL